MGTKLRAASLALIVAFAAAGCGAHGGPEQKGPPPLAVDVGKAVQQDIATFVTLDGQISPLQQSTLSSPIAGTVVAVYVNEGQHVSAGELLAKIDDSTYRAQAAQYSAQIAQTQATLQGSSLQRPITQQSTSAGVITAQQNISQAQNNLIKDQANLANAQLVYNQNLELFKQGYQSQQQLAASKAQYVAAQQQIAVDRDILRNNQAALAVAKQNTGQNDIQAMTMQQNSAQVKGAQAQLQYVQTQIAQTNVTAPYDGVITQRLLDPGAYQTGNQGILQISQIADVYVNANVPDENLAYVRKGTPVTFTTSSVPGKVFRGSVFDVNAIPTQNTLSYRARIKQNNPGDQLRGGMLVTVNVRKEFHRGAVVVQRSAINSSEAGTFVFTIADGKAKQVPVKLGIQTDTLAEVQSPEVRPGTTVITTRPDALQNGSVVAIVNGPGAQKPGGAGAGGPH